MERDVVETFEPKLNADGSIATVSFATPAEFKKKKVPFDATITEDIEGSYYESGRTL